MDLNVTYSCGAFRNGQEWNCAKPKQIFGLVLVIVPHITVTVSAKERSLILLLIHVICASIDSSQLVDSFPVI